MAVCGVCDDRRRDLFAGEEMKTTRRGFIIGLTGIIAAPAIVKAASLMPVRVHDLQEKTLSEMIEETLRNHPDEIANSLYKRFPGYE